MPLSAEQLIARYHDFLERHPHEGYSFERSSDEQYVLATDYATGQIDFWDDIVEFNVNSKKNDENVFALHFQLLEEDWEHCEGLFGEMEQALLDQQDSHTVRVLLSCTAGMTTFMFAQQLNQAAKSLSWDYEFDAVPITQIYEEGFKYDAVLLAPQVAFQYDKIAEVFRDRPVIQIPTRMFASYDTGACLQMVHDELERHWHTTAQRAVYKIMHGIDQDACVLTVVLKRAAHRVALVWRIYDRGEVVDEGKIVKTQRQEDVEAQISPLHDGTITLCDVKNLIGTVLHAREMGSKVQAIGVAFIGSVWQGVISLPASPFHQLDLQSVLESKFGLPVVVANNVNAAALGWYAQQDSYQSVVFHSQSRGLYIGGQGIVSNGHLIEGKNSLAGEIHLMYPALSYSREFEAGSVRRELWNPDELVRLLARVFAVDAAIVAPEVICVRSELTPDMDAIKAELAKYLPAENQPELIFVPDFADYAALGLVILAMKRLRRVE